MELIELVAIVLVVCVVLMSSVVLRRRLLLRGGAVDMSLRLRVRAGGGGWAMGVGRYSAGELQWFRLFGLSVRPSRVLARDQIQVAAQRYPERSESWSVPSDAMIVVIRPESDAGPVSLAMDPSAITGLLSWLEAAPPG